MKVPPFIEYRADGEPVDAPPFPSLVAGMEPSAMRSLTVLGAMVNKGAASSAAVTASGSGGAIAVGGRDRGKEHPGQDQGFPVPPFRAAPRYKPGTRGCRDAANVAYGCAR